MESMNPSGTGKDRAVSYMLKDALRTHNQKQAKIDDTIEVFEGTSGSTGIALAFQCNAIGISLNIVMPDDQAEEKRALLRSLGATVTVVPSCGIANKDHYVNTARRLAMEKNGIFINQFENLINYRVHYEVTGPEIYGQMRAMGKHIIDAFVMSSGTGGTIAGVSRCLRYYSYLQQYT